MLIGLLRHARAFGGAFSGETLEGRGGERAGLGRESRGCGIHIIFAVRAAVSGKAVRSSTYPQGASMLSALLDHIDFPDFIAFEFELHLDFDD